MALMTNEMRVIRGKIAAHSRSDAEHYQPEKVAAAQRELAFLRFEQYIQNQIGSLSPITVEEHTRLIRTLVDLYTLGGVA